ncbi:unnamed protein product [Didymodactylos carnosus]|uniref:VCBS repeat-containing protein n=2 Tax=Didymodactylos carnosus TaxID=1234261 RepID=A0A8S2DF48_9BILA|nr:unnamed protein product [Didymodactylos carnosus]CAF3671310.1 unnamed protein product [Didymodactylos carnosus]
MSVLLGYGNGSFEAKTVYPTDLPPDPFAVGDFNNDSRMDIVLANNVNNSVRVLLSYGNGTYIVQTVYPTDLPPDSIAMGDFNGDNRLDIVIGSNMNNTCGTVQKAIHDAKEDIQRTMDDNTKTNAEKKRMITELVNEVEELSTQLDHMQQYDR